MRVHPVRLTDLIRADFRKANMVKLAFGNELGHDACALVEGGALNDACGLEQVQFLGPTELGEDKIDLAFQSRFSATHALTTIGEGGRWENIQVTICTRWCATLRYTRFCA